MFHALFRFPAYSASSAVMVGGVAEVSRTHRSASIWARGLWSIPYQRLTIFATVKTRLLTSPHARWISLPPSVLLR